MADERVDKLVKKWNCIKAMLGLKLELDMLAMSTAFMLRTANDLPRVASKETVAGKPSCSPSIEAAAGMESDIVKVSTGRLAEELSANLPVQVTIRWEREKELLCIVNTPKSTLLSNLRAEITPKIAYLKREFDFLMLGDILVGKHMEHEITVFSLWNDNKKSYIAVLRPPVTVKLSRPTPLLPLGANCMGKKKGKGKRSQGGFNLAQGRKATFQAVANSAYANSLASKLLN